MWAYMRVCDDAMVSCEHFIICTETTHTMEQCRNRTETRFAVCLYLFPSTYPFVKDEPRQRDRYGVAHVGYKSIRQQSR